MMTRSETKWLGVCPSRVVGSTISKKRKVLSLGEATLSLRREFASETQKLVEFLVKPGELYEEEENL